MATYSTLTEARTAYLANADYEETGSVAKAKTFCTACRALLVLLPSAGKHSGEEVEFDQSQIAKQLEHARTWLLGNDTTGSAGGNVRHFDMQDFRS